MGLGEDWNPTGKTIDASGLREEDVEKILRLVRLLRKKNWQAGETDTHMES